MSAFQEMAAKHGMTQEAAQAVIDMHLDSISQYAVASQEQTLQQQHRAFADVRKGWQQQVLADEQLGGAGHQTAMAAVARMRDAFVPEKDKADFDQFLRVTGAGDHPAFLRLLHNAARRFDEPKFPPTEIKPVPQTVKRDMRSLYNKTN